MDLRAVTLIAVCVAVTIVLRFLPFVIFGRKKEIPGYITYLSGVLPYAIMGMLDWNNSAEEQAAGLAQAAQVENFQVFLQPCTEHYNKNVWDNCAKALAMRSDAELDACLENLLAWLRDMNWPGAFLILERLQAFQNSAALHRAIAESLLCAQALGDEVWEENLRKLQNCENTIST